MALRVLLADNSETIKKVIQLTLQDYAIDLRVVNLGVDVLDVAIKFKPDIVFVDVLLQKKSGYDVAKEIKTNTQLKNTPVVLMWSGFMELDEQKTKESMVDLRLEKPFDAQTLRDAVQKLTSKTKNNALSGFLDFPNVQTENAQGPAKAPASTKTLAQKDPLKELEKIKTEAQKFSPTSDSAHIIDLDESSSEEFEIKNFDKPEKTKIPNTDDELTKSFVLNIPDDFSADDSPADFGKIEAIQDMSFLLNPEEEKKKNVNQNKTPATPLKTEIHATEKKSTPVPALANPPKAAHSMPNATELEDIVRKQVNEVLEKIAWQVVPEVAAEIIRKELDRLLKDQNSKV